MKKRLLILPLFVIILLPLIIAPSYNYQPHDYLEYRFEYNPNEFVKTSRSFLIIDDDGRMFHRTFTNYNKESKDYDFFKTNNNRKGIYRNLFDRGIDFSDRDKKFYKHFEVEKNADCPPGWTCEKRSKK